ncbi:hypothetical protein KCH_77850 [Kitasatospora cheerisanensis KCTC 2395]|uniref:Uncharacterized protein n=1 Tax=Kitasatospora cheerisanensis KCTC 2395 TaxID=1348663 RepID=A0A066YG36_9ACTN|nr:hypothetical protein KCH_77850 [Kitasatospora cheerisanensis KCTC 2395]
MEPDRTLTPVVGRPRTGGPPGTSRPGSQEPCKLEGVQGSWLPVSEPIRRG